MGYAVFGIIVIIAGVLAWLSLQSWRWANVVLVFLIVCAASVFGYLAAYTLKVHTAWRVVAAKQTTEIEKEDADRLKKLDGIKNENGGLANGIRQLTQTVHDLVVRRGPAWFDVQMARKPGADGTTDVQIESPEPHGLAENSIVYAFDAEPLADGGHYLGEFVVSKAPADGKVVTLVPNMPMSDGELKSLQGAKGVWTIYLKMPTDENDVFKGITKEQLASLVPDDFSDAYREGTRTEQEMSDYTYLFHEFSLHRRLVQDEMIKIESNASRLLQAEARNQAKIKDRQQEKADLVYDNQNFEIERDAVARYRAALAAKDQRLSTEVAALRTQNEKLAAEIKSLQLDAADAINRKLETAQANP